MITPPHTCHHNTGTVFEIPNGLKVRRCRCGQFWRSYADVGGVNVPLTAEDELLAIAVWKEYRRHDR